MANQSTKYRAKHKAAGLCRTCPAKAAPGCSMCRLCLDVANDRKAQKRYGEGKCWRCLAADPDPGYKSCTPCRIHIRDYRRSKRTGDRAQN